MYKVGINFDEISDDPDKSIEVMRECGLTTGELRTVNGKNFVFWDDDEVNAFKAKVDDAGIELVAAATPLFKWYVNEDDPEVAHDSFGFNPRLSNHDKRKIVERTFEIASMLELPRLRVFSGLGDAEDAGAVFANDPLLAFSLELAEKHGIDLYLENEPVCRVYRKQHMIDLLSQQKHPRLKLWLDIANLIEVDEEIDGEFLAQVASRLGYVHIKDFVIQDGVKNYKPVGEGSIDYRTILERINQLHIDDLIFTVETHAKQDKISASITSVKATQDLVRNLQ